MDIVRDIRVRSRIPYEEREIDAPSDGLRQIERFRLCGHIHRRRFSFAVSQTTWTRNRDWVSIDGFLLAGWGYIAFSDWKYQSRLTTLIAPRWALTSSATSVRFENIIRYFTGKKHGICSIASACITKHDRTHAFDNAPSVYLVPFLCLSSALIALNPFGLRRILNFPEHGNNITQRNVPFTDWHIRLWGSRCLTVDLCAPNAHPAGGLPASSRTLTDGIHADWKLAFYRLICSKTRALRLKGVHQTRHVAVP